MRALFKSFEEKGRMVKILNACLGRDGIRITIGHENPDPSGASWHGVFSNPPARASPAPIGPLRSEGDSLRTTLQSADCGASTYAPACDLRWNI